MSVTTLFATTAAFLFHESRRLRSVPISASGIRVPVRALAWHAAQFLAKTSLPVSARAASMGNGYFGAGSAGQVLVQPRHLIEKVLLVRRRRARAGRGRNP